MSKNLKKALFVTPAALSAALLVSGDALAQSFSSETSANDLLQQIEAYSAEGTSSMGQGLTGASQFSDVSPGDWAFQALDDLVRRYDCLKGYPNGTYRGNRALSRYEFAAGLNACLQQIERLIAETTADFATKEDLETMSRLMEEFEAELAMLGTRVDNLESRVAFLEDNQFSTTTKLAGQVVWTLGVPWGGTAGLPVNDELTFNYRARLAFDTSFTGKDRLRTRLDTSNALNGSFSGGNLGTANASLNAYGNEDNTVNVDKVWYRFPANDKLMLHVVARGAFIDDIFDAGSTAPYSYDDVPIGNAYNTAFHDTHGTGTAAVAANYMINDTFGIDVGFFSAQANNATRGLFGGNIALPIQLNADFDKLQLALGYARTFAPGGEVALSSAGTSKAITPFADTATSANHYHLSASYDVSDSINVSGWLGYTEAFAEVGSATGPYLINKGESANIWNWAFNVSFPDLFQEADVLRLGFGQLPTAARVQGATPDDDSSALMANIEYRFDVTDNIQLAPAFFAVFNPEGRESNDTMYAAVLRTIFSF
ncbi:iron uptake porin [Spirulina major CS-329]|uniref:iron uptake porin n=1 Tax=Spirulina TaxID=1154 RepID=UPI00232B4B71|nr:MULTISPECIES: iron uptake porin [Spirulina]MDB9493654.1 iron uptake porin [Spirulina subsalsa CS-330]MDB9505036.1 iron uptake porin [Spirulina major CS-329]